MKSSILIVLIVILIMIICCIMAACWVGIAVYFTSNQTGDMDFRTSPQTGMIAPDFQLKTMNGDDISLHEFRGKPVMLNFWALWCDPCIKEMPIIQERYQQHYPDLVILAIEEDGKSANILNFILESSFSFLVLAGENSVAREYNVRAYPTSFFIDEQGVIQSIVVGSLSGPELDAELAKVGVGD